MGDIVALEGRASPLQEVRFEYEGGEGLLCYGAPSARDREIMGGLVPFGAPWRGGANEPTTLHLSAATTLGGIPLEAGSYSLYAIPGESEWEFFVNSNFERWGVPINDDVRSTELGSFAVNVGATEEMVETLVYEHMEGHFMLSQARSTPSPGASPRTIRPASRCGPVKGSSLSRAAPSRST